MMNVSRKSFLGGMTDSVSMRLLAALPFLLTVLIAQSAYAVGGWVA